jgi:hypothetical protein
METPVRARSARSPAEAIARSVGSGYGQPVHRSGSNDHRRWRLRARLLGGGADGRSVEVDSLMEAIVVYMVNGTTIACDRALPHRGEGRFIGTYRLASGSGPEPPVYVAGI